MKGIVFTLLFVSLVFGAFRGEYSGNYNQKKVFMKLQKSSMGKISGNLQIGEKNYIIKAEVLLNNRRMAKGLVINNSKERKLLLEQRSNKIIVTLYNPLEDFTLNDIKEKKNSKTPSMVKNKVIKKIKHTTSSTIVGRWIGSDGELWLMGDNTYRFIRVERDYEFIPKKRFKGAVDKIREKIKKNRESVNDKKKKAGVKVEVSNVSIQIGDVVVDEENIEAKADYNNKSLEEKYREKLAKRKREEEAKRKAEEAQKKALNTPTSSGRWFVKNSILYITNSQGESISFGQYKLMNNSKSLLIIKNNGNQIIYNRIDK